MPKRPLSAVGAVSAAADFCCNACQWTAWQIALAVLIVALVLSGTSRVLQLCRVAKVLCGEVFGRAFPPRHHCSSGSLSVAVHIVSKGEFSITKL
eukprot:1191136-Prorocentrum_minimum.AAC.3